MGWGTTWSRPCWCGNTCGGEGVQGAGRGKGHGMLRSSRVLPGPPPLSLGWVALRRGAALAPVSSSALRGKGVLTRAPSLLLRRRLRRLPTTIVGLLIILRLALEYINGLSVCGMGIRRVERECAPSGASPSACAERPWTTLLQPWQPQRR